MMNRTLASKSLFYIVALIIPLSLWYWAGGRLSFLDTASFLNSIARAAAITGICFFAGNLILSGRYKMLDRAFGGLDRLFAFHRQTGIVTFSLLSVHVIFIFIGALIYSVEAFWYLLLDYKDFPTDMGKIAYAGLFVIIALTLYLGRKMKYERLRFLHRFMGAFFLFGALHVYFIPSDISYMYALRYYTLMLMGIALTSYLVRTVFAQFFIRRIQADVMAVNNLGGLVTEIIMQPQIAGRIPFDPGQFIFVKFKQAGFPYEDHPFSLTASTEEGRLRISAKGIGDFSRELARLKPGARAKIQGPYGGFSFKNASSKKQIWIAGGIGVTPFMSAARTFRDRAGDPAFNGYNIHFFYSVQTPSDLVFGSELKAISQKIPDLKIYPWITEQNGLLTIDAITAMGNLENTDIFICGPKPMMNAFRAAFRAKGVPASRIHFELFRLL